jgi:hypothetical protein
MGRDFDDVVGGVGMRLGELGDYYFVDPAGRCGGACIFADRSVRATWFYQIAGDGSTRF